MATSALPCVGPVTVNHVIFRPWKSNDTDAPAVRSTAYEWPYAPWLCCVLQPYLAPMLDCSTSVGVVKSCWVIGTALPPTSTIDGLEPGGATIAEYASPATSGSEGWSVAVSTLPFAQFVSKPLRE